MSTRCPSSSECQKSDRTSSADDNRGSEREAGGFDAMKNDAEGFEERSLSKGDVVRKPKYCQAFFRL